MAQDYEIFQQEIEEHKIAISLNYDEGCVTMAQITVQRGGSYAPCSYLICRVREDDTFSKYDEANTVLVQTDWEFPRVAADFGFVPCECGTTDGTVDCHHKTANDMISAAADWLDDHEGKLIEDPGYFAEELL